MQVFDKHVNMCHCGYQYSDTSPSRPLPQPQRDTYKPLISLGLAAVGGTATSGVSAQDAQRLKIIVTNQGPAYHALLPIQAPGGLGIKLEAPGMPGDLLGGGLL